MKHLDETLPCPGSTRASSSSLPPASIRQLGRIYIEKFYALFLVKLKPSGSESGMKFASNTAGCRSMRAAPR
ncbi:hypothetical protein BJS_03520 [Bradyrhizobium japonicum SEMIA 5079]|nr:hypothetical protein BJS_03520 [Bradyrhizobium japonicum SEMIA 5079]